MATFDDPKWIEEYLLPHCEDANCGSGLVVKAKLGSYCTHIEFSVFKIHDQDEIISGYVKWDGCMNWQTDPNCMYHACNSEDIINVSRCLLAAANLAASMIPTYDNGADGFIDPKSLQLVAGNN